MVALPQGSVSGARLKSASWLLALALAATPLHAQTQIVRLSCEGENAEDAMLVQVNYASKMVIWASAIEMKWLGPVQAKITDEEIAWSGVGQTLGTRYEINRISGEFLVCRREDCAATTCKRTMGQQ